MDYLPSASSCFDVEHDGRDLNVNILFLASEIANKSNFCVVEHLTPLESAKPVVSKPSHSHRDGQRWDKPLKQGCQNSKIQQSVEPMVKETQGLEDKPRWILIELCRIKHWTPFNTKINYVIDLTASNFSRQLDEVAALILASVSGLFASFKVSVTWKIFSAYLKGLSKYRRMAFFFLKYLFSF